MRYKTRIMKDKSLHDIKQLAKKAHELTVRAVAEYSIEVDAIIVSRCQEEKRIESALDGMLDFCFDKNMLEQYRKLCKYYHGINPSAAVEYVYAYRDVWDSRAKRFRKK